MREKGKLIGYATLTFVFGVGLASSLEWPSGSVASPAVQATLPPRKELREVAGLSEAFVSIAEAVTPAVVRIQAERQAAHPGGRRLPKGFQQFFGPGEEEQEPREVPQIAGGTGFLVSADGVILTNNHVVQEADQITVTLWDKRTFEARLVGRDLTTDVAVIKIEATGLPAAKLGDSDQARVGEWVLAIGNPGFQDGASPLDFTVTSGIISAKGRPLDIINRELLANESTAANYAIEDFLQTDAVINPGNSGGPLINLRGEVIGVNTAIASESGFYQGYGFAIPANLARRVTNDLLSHGRVRRALLGISIADVTPEDAEVYRLKQISGVLVEDFAADAPARSAGVERGDVIVAVNGQRVDRVGQLQRLVAQNDPGSSVELTVVRYGSERRFRVRLTEAPFRDEPVRRATRAVRARSELGIEVDDLTAAQARRLGFERSGGALITEVRPLSPAHRKGVERMWRIVAIDRKPVDSAREAQSVLRAARSGQVLSLLVQYSTGRTRIFNIRVP